MDRRSDPVAEKPAEAAQPEPCAPSVASVQSQRDRREPSQGQQPEFVREIRADSFYSSPLDYSSPPDSVWHSANRLSSSQPPPCGYSLVSERPFIAEEFLSDSPRVCRAHRRSPRSIRQSDLRAKCERGEALPS